MSKKDKVIKAPYINYIIPDNISDPNATKLMQQACSFYSRYNNDMYEKAQKLQSKIEEAEHNKKSNEDAITTYEEAYKDTLRKLGL